MPGWVGAPLNSFIAPVALLGAPFASIPAGLRVAHLVKAAAAAGTEEDDDDMPNHRHCNLVG